jgi:hypothetical protein
MPFRSAKTDMIAFSFSARPEDTTCDEPTCLRSACAAALPTTAVPPASSRVDLTDATSVRPANTDFFQLSNSPKSLPKLAVLETRRAPRAARPRHPAAPRKPSRRKRRDGKPRQAAPRARATRRPTRRTDGRPQEQCRPRTVERTTRSSHGSPIGRGRPPCHLRSPTGERRALKLRPQDQDISRTSGRGQDGPGRQTETNAAQ